MPIGLMVLPMVEYFRGYKGVGVGYLLLVKLRQLCSPLVAVE